MATTAQLVRAVTESAFSQTCEESAVIHLFEGGSALHGARLTEKSDLDIYGIFIEPKQHVFGLHPFEHCVTSTSDMSRRNNSEDTDITLYTLRRWARLACQGNPTALSFLFAPNAKAERYDFNGCHDLDFSLWGLRVRRLSGAIVAKSAAGHFTGFVTGQMKRLLGEKGQGKHGQRPELEAVHGYDTKAAMHAVRLCGEGIELMQTGTITYPREDRQMLIEIRQGAWSLDKVCGVVSARLAALEDAYKNSPLQAKPDRDKVDQLLIEMYEEFYEY
jgi:predicted nucleotidyltransferase